MYCCGSSGSVSAARPSTSASATAHRTAPAATTAMSHHQGARRATTGSTPTRKSATPTAGSIVRPGRQLVPPRNGGVWIFMRTPSASNASPHWDATATIAAARTRLPTVTHAARDRRDAWSSALAADTSTATDGARGINVCATERGYLSSEPRPFVVRACFAFRKRQNGARLRSRRYRRSHDRRRPPGARRSRRDPACPGVDPLVVPGHRRRQRLDRRLRGGRGGTRRARRARAASRVRQRVLRRPSRRRARRRLLHGLRRLARRRRSPTRR